MKLSTQQCLVTKRNLINNTLAVLGRRATTANLFTAPGYDSTRQTLNMTGSSTYLLGHSYLSCIHMDSASGPNTMLPGSEASHCCRLTLVAKHHQNCLLSHSLSPSGTGERIGRVKWENSSVEIRGSLLTQKKETTEQKELRTKNE